MPPRKTPFWWCFVLAFVILISDQLTKAWVLADFWLGKSVEVIPGFLYWTYVRNDGIAFGLFQGNNILMGIVVGMILAIAVYWARELAWERVGVNLFTALVAGGAVGNLIDRLRHGYVIDFVDADLGFMRWPAFNIADAAISTAMVLMVWMMLVGYPVQRQAASPQSKENPLGKSTT